MIPSALWTGVTVVWLGGFLVFLLSLISPPKGRWCRLQYDGHFFLGPQPPSELPQNLLTGRVSAVSFFFLFYSQQLFILFPSLQLLA